jgi:prepilin-type N-terminal cleavage/methylation domain-containing protein
LPGKGLTMKCIIKTKRGFTLVEVIVVMIMIGIIAAAAGVGYVQVVKGTVFTKMNAATIQKGQITITKLVKEFGNISISSITVAEATSIKFKTVKFGETTADTIVTISGDKITYGGDDLTDQVSGFTLKYYSDTQTETTVLNAIRIIEITLKLTGADGIQSEFKARVKPRNL